MASLMAGAPVRASERWLLEWNAPTHKISFWLVGRDEEHPHFSSEVLLCQLVGFERFTALSIYSPFHNTVNPPFLSADRPIRVRFCPLGGGTAHALILVMCRERGPAHADPD
jgi:hypothetical protein